MGFSRRSNLSLSRCTQLVVSLCLALAGVCAAQQQSGAQGSKTQASDAPPQASSTQPKAQSANSAFSEATVENVLKRINDGFVSHSAPIVLSAFDRTKMRDYSRFASQLQSTFSQYESFRLHFHVTDFTAEANSGSALVEVEYEATPLSDVSPPVRKGDQLHFEFVRTPQGWKITAMRPWNFFS